MLDDTTLQFQKKIINKSETSSANCHFDKNNINQKLFGVVAKKMKPLFLSSLHKRKLNPEKRQTREFINNHNSRS